MRLWPLVSRRAVDAFVLVLAVLIQVDVWHVRIPGPRPVVVLLMLLATLPLLLRRRFPFVAAVCVFAALVGLTFAHPQATASQGSEWTLIALFLAFWSVGAHAEPRQALAGLAAGFAAMVVIIERDPELGYEDTAGHFLVVAGIWLAAFLLRRRTDRAGELEQRAARLEREREERGQAAVAVERARIARELHDVIAHSVSVMTVQAGAARLLLAEQPGRAREPLLAVEQTGRQALAEMRRLLGILRHDNGEPKLEPQPRLADLDALLAQTRAAGLAVELAVEGERADVPPGIDLAAYRIVQEALTNARRHAGPARAEVTVRYGRYALELEVLDDGRGAAAGSWGSGLAGLRERAAVYGGRLDAGPRAGAGFAVRARLPLAPAPPARRSAETGPHHVAPAGTPPSRARTALSRYAFDVLVVALAVAAEIEIWVASVPGPKLVLVPAVLLTTLPLLLRRRFPFAAPVVVFGVMAAISFAGDVVGSTATGLAALFLSFWALGAHNEWNQALAGAAIGVAAMVVAFHRDARVEAFDGTNSTVFGAAIALAAFALQRRARRAAELEERSARLERERDEQMQEAAAAERARIARELHDVVAHSVSVMTVQAGAARLLLDAEPGRAREPLLAVEEIGRGALDELRRLLGLLSRDDGEPSLEPQPGLGDLETLVTEARAAGLAVDLAVEGERAALPPGIDLAAYRIVQEALTNARRHAGPARARVTVGYGREALELEIVDDGRGPRNGHGGHGLVGMRERAALYGGELEAGSRTGGGFQVRARLPIRSGSA